MSDIAIKVENLSKYYRLGVINSGTLSRDLQSWIYKRLGKEDPNKRIGYKESDADGFWALKDLNFEIKKGDRVGIIGHNGAGKSTLLKMLSQISSPTTGKIYIDGKIASLLEVGTGFNPELTGRENIYLNGAILGMKKKEVDRKIDEIIAFSEIERHIDTPVKRYSSGMYVRLAFAVAAHLDSDILIADEVLAVGDAAFQKKALGKMNELSNGQGRTVLFVSHNMAQVKNLCNKGIVLEKGKVVRQDDDINESIADYLGLNKIEKNNDVINWENDGSLKNEYFCIKKMEILNEDNSSVKNALIYGRNYKLRLTFFAEKDTLNSIRFAIIFYKNTERLFSVGIPDDSIFKSGYYYIDFPIDTKLFYEGTYSALASGSVTNISWIVPPRSFDVGVKFKVVMNSDDKKFDVSINRLEEDKRLC